MKDMQRQLGFCLRVLLGALLPMSIACSSGSTPENRGAPTANPTASRPDATASASAGNLSTPRIVIVGDSLTAGLGLPIEEAYPALLQRRLNEKGLRYQVINAGISGDTSAGGLARLDWALDGDVRILVLALGGNDALRGLPTEQLQANLAAMIERAQARNVAVILAGMEAPPNWGAEYTKAFHQVYPALAAKYHVPLVPFLLANVAGIERLNQQDGIHPTAEGDQIVADTVWRVLEPVAARQALPQGGSPGS